MQDQEQEISIESDFHMPKYRGCDVCTHAPVCEAYNKLQGIEKGFLFQFQYLEDFPAKPVTLATMCKEFKEKQENEVLNTYKPKEGCSSC